MKWLVCSLAFYLAMSIFLSIVYIQRKERIRLSAQTLLNAPEINEFVANKIAMLSPEDALSKYSLELLLVLDRLQPPTTEHDTNNPASYIVDANKVNEEIQKSLLHSFLKYDSACNEYLTHKAPETRQRVQSSREAATVKFSKAQSTAKESSIGAKGKSVITLILEDTLKIQIEWMKTRSQVHWNNGPEKYERFIKYADNIYTSSTLTICKSKLTSLESSIVDSHRIAVYGRIYDLNHVTRAEQKSIMKHLQLSILDLQSSLMDLQNEFIFK